MSLFGIKLPAPNFTPVTTAVCHAANAAPAVKLGTAAALSFGVYAAVTSSASTHHGLHTVKAGDSIWSIAHAHGSTVAAVASANGLDHKALKPLAVGAKLKLPKKK